MKVRVLLGQVLKFVVVVDIFFCPIAKKQVELLALVTRFGRRRARTPVLHWSEQPLQHGAERGDSGTGGDENRIAHGRAENEITERTLAVDLVTFLHVAKKVGHEAVLHPVQAQGELVVAIRWRSDGVCADDFLAIGLVGFKGEPLSSDEAETGDALHFEFEMLCEFGEPDGADEPRGEGLKWHHLYR